MISDVAGVVGVSHDAVAIDNERPWHLEGVTNRRLYAVALSGGLMPRIIGAGPRTWRREPRLRPKAL